MIYFDPTEMRDNSKLSPRIIKAGQSLIGLETATGADLLITNFPRLGNSVAQPPGSILLNRAVRGGLLIQRKSDNDLFHSIQEPGLSSILARMCVHEGAYPYLMIVGKFEEAEDRKVILNGFKTGWHYNSFSGALDSWMMNGGCARVFEDEEKAADWILLRDKYISKIPEKEVRPKHNRDHLRIDPRPWRSVLEEFPGVGPSYSSAIADYCADLASSLCWMSDHQSFGLGVGIGMKQNFREFLGLKENEVLIKLDEDDPVLKEIIRACSMKGVENVQEMASSLDPSPAGD